MIEHICEPSRLILTWQAPDLDGVRKRFGVADLIRDGEDATLVYRDDPEVEEARALGYAGYPAFKTKVQEHKTALAPFIRRLPPRDRSDFGRYLNTYRLPGTNISDFALLAYTEARLPGDGFGLVSDLRDCGGPSEHFIEIAGFRHYLAHSEGLQIGDQVRIEREPNNSHDSQAVAVSWRGRVIGYVNRFQAPTFSQWLEDRTVNATFERRNGTVERPRGYLFVEVR